MKKDFNFNIVVAFMFLSMNMMATEHQITIQSSICGTQTSYMVEDGASVTLLATPDAGSKFVQWSDGDTSNPRTVVATTDAVYTAQFETLDGSAMPQKCKATVYGGTTNPYVGDFDKGSQLRIVAVPLPGYKFKQWTDGNTNNPRSLSINTDITLHAEYEPYEAASTSPSSALRTVNVLIAGCDNVIEGRYPAGTELTLIATPNDSECDQFAQWEDASTSATRSVTVTEDATYTAEFEKITYTVKGEDSTGGKVKVEK